MELIWIEECDSTNSVLARENPAHGTALFARRQTAGRGQRGNSWESEPGKNLTFSLLVRPQWVDAARQFAVSQAVSLAIVGVLEKYLGEGARLRIKWPNDIYAGDRKICGILIENSLTGRSLNRCIVGVGINVNQTEFRSDAPNPVSMAQIAGREFPLDALAGEFAAVMLAAVERLKSADAMTAVSECYFAALWRVDGFYPYQDIESGKKFMARIHSIGPMGHLTLQTSDGNLLTYAFKQVVAMHYSL